MNKMERKQITISKQEARAIIFWLRKEAKTKWYGGSYETMIEEVYNRLNEICGHQQTPKKWKWKQ